LGAEGLRNLVGLFGVLSGFDSEDFFARLDGAVFASLALARNALRARVLICRYGARVQKVVFNPLGICLRYHGTLETFRKDAAYANIRVCWVDSRTHSLRLALQTRHSD
jgi:hypothetical protein